MSYDSAADHQVWDCTLRRGMATPDEPDGQHTTLVTQGWRILEPDELEYDVAYQEAARAHRIYGWDMPYADASEEEEEVICQGSGRQETGRYRPTRFT